MSNVGGSYKKDIYLVSLGHGLANEGRRLGFRKGIRMRLRALVGRKDKGMGVGMEDYIKYTKTCCIKQY